MPLWWLFLPLQWLLLLLLLLLPWWMLRCVDVIEIMPVSQDQQWKVVVLVVVVAAAV